MSILAALLLALPHRVYVSNEASDDVSVIENDAVVARIAVGKRPRGIKLGTGGKLYVAVSGSPRAGPGQREEDLPPADRAQDGIAVVDLGRGEVTGRERFKEPELSLERRSFFGAERASRHALVLGDEHR